jgi:heparosan-N-sulfate-glucuronate 5-epimerase
MSLQNRLRYYGRIFPAYFFPRQSQLAFWHETPEENADAGIQQLGEYYMLFAEKADYCLAFDRDGIPVLNYRGHIGFQYNPIAIAQWGLGNYNLFSRTAAPDRKKKFLAASDWLSAHLQQNSYGRWVWNHQFNWEYRVPLKAPWYSALAQGAGISLLVRAHYETGEMMYLEAAQRAFATFLADLDDGGVAFTDEREKIWFEEYVVSPPTHILNGFIWAIWGIYDYFLATQNPTAHELFQAAVDTLRSNLDRYDLGFWSLYEQSDTFLPMVASPHYHRLHITQLRVMHRMTGDEVFLRYADKWQAYTRSLTNRARAGCYKSAFKLCYY